MNSYTYDECDATGLQEASQGTSEYSPNSVYTMRGNDVDYMTLYSEFRNGTGPEYSGFGEGHPMVKDLKSSYIVALATSKFILGGSKPLVMYDVPFGLIGACIAGSMTEQFIGGARISIIPTDAGNLFIVNKTTDAYSYNLHVGESIPRGLGSIIPESTIYQRFMWVQK